MTQNKDQTATKPSQDFVRAIISEDVRSGKHGGSVVTRFPPEPNGFLHIGHAKSICLNFGSAAEHGGITHLRFDDTNPEAENELYVSSIQEDILWLGFDWGDHLYFASDYFDLLYGYATDLIRKHMAYIDSSSEEEIREYRGTVNDPGKESPFRERSVDENLNLFERMRAGEFPDGAHVLRARIDMTSKNMLMRDPILYRIRHLDHYRTGDSWCIYPLYDFTHCLSDSIEGITHSVCTLEFDNNRELYNWILDNVDVPTPHPEQYEFARLNLQYTVLSKRKLLQLVEEGHVDGWDDPRMPTIAGMRRRGVPPSAIRKFCDMIGVAKTENRIDIGKLEYAIRHELNHKAPRVMCVLNPLKVIITNYPENEIEEIDAPYFPKDIDKEGSRAIHFTRELFIEESDFEENPPKGFKRLSPGEEVRLRYGYVIRCVDVVKDNAGNILEIHCTYDPDTRSNSKSSERKVKGTIHWVSATESIPIEVRLYDRLFLEPDPDNAEENEDFRKNINQNSLTLLTDSRIERSVNEGSPATVYQFERNGYFVRDPIDSRPNKIAFNRTVTLRDGWAKIQKSLGGPTETLKHKTLPDTIRKNKRKKLTSTTLPSDTKLDNPEIKRVYDELISAYHLPEAEALALAQEIDLLDLFLSASKHTSDHTTLAKLVLHEVPRARKGNLEENMLFGGPELGRIVELISSGVLSKRSAKEVMVLMAADGGDPDSVIRERGLVQVSEPSTLGPIVKRIIEQNADKAEEYRNGKTGLLRFFVGQVMKDTGGAADPALTQNMIRDALDKD
tara:strand:+ start:2263 stop:4623 length:2361 start_codon:yes stop_codon:yes gene_type:complete